MAKLIKITDQNGNDVPRMTAIAKYFRKPDESVAVFSNGCKALTEDDKDELAIGAAQALGYKVEVTEV